MTRKGELKLQMGLRLQIGRPLNKEITLDYKGGLSVIIKVLKMTRGRQREKAV